MKNFKQPGVNLTLTESLLVHPTHTDGLVNSGDPVVRGTIVGVATIDAAATTDGIPIKTDGVFDLSVTATNAGGNVAVAIGDRLYIDGASAVISKDSTKTPFGKALAAVTSGATAVIEVKVTGAA
jgi:predicted RecA/RadA family phage recombinase